MNWRRRLDREIVTIDGRRLRTLHDARAYMLRLTGGRERREYWQRAAELVLQAAEGGATEPATLQIQIALLHDGTLDISRTVK